MKLFILGACLGSILTNPIKYRTTGFVQGVDYDDPPKTIKFVQGVDYDDPPKSQEFVQGIDYDDPL